MDEQKVLKNIFRIAMDCPELNMGNYDDNQVLELNNAMIQIVQLLDQLPYNSYVGCAEGIFGILDVK